MKRTFGRSLTALGALVGFVLIAVLAGAGYALVSTIRVGNEALSTYADELILAWSLQEAHERKTASGRGFLLAHDERMKEEFEKASADGETRLQELRTRVSSKKGIALLDESERAWRDHDRSLRNVMAMDADARALATWTTDTRPRATHARAAMDAFIHYKEKRLREQRARVHRAQQSAGWVMTGTAASALLLAGFGGGPLLLSAQRTYAAELRARTAAEQERQFFFTLLDQLPIGIVAADPSASGVMHVSGFARRMLEEDGSQLRLDDLPIVRALHGETIAQEEIQTAGQRVYSVTAGPIRDADGKIIAAVVALADITDRKRGEKERELFIGALGHDLRNPLQAISMAANALLARADTPDAKKPAARIASNAQRMNQLINDLLDFARSQHGAFPLKPEPCDLGSIAKEVIADLKVALADRDFHIESQPGCDGRWDRARLSQVFQNLLANAVEHGDSSSPIKVQVRCDRDRERVRVDVTNRGAIPSEERGRIFEPFRARASSRGLGLGLYIVRALVEAHGGTIMVDGTDHETTFRIELPVEAKSQ